jgi:hypothetical protein
MKKKGLGERRTWGKKDCDDPVITVVSRRSQLSMTTRKRGSKERNTREMNTSAPSKKGRGEAREVTHGKEKKMQGRPGHPRPRQERPLGSQII